MSTGRAKRPLGIAREPVDSSGARPANVYLSTRPTAGDLVEAGLDTCVAEAVVNTLEDSNE